MPCKTLYTMSVADISTITSVSSSANVCMYAEHITEGPPKPMDIDRAHGNTQVQILNRHLVELADKVPALRAGQEEPIPYTSVVDPQNINPYRVGGKRGGCCFTSSHNTAILSCTASSTQYRALMYLTCLSPRTVLQVDTKCIP